MGVNDSISLNYLIDDELLIHDLLTRLNESTA